MEPSGQEEPRKLQGLKKKKLEKGPAKNTMAE